MLTELCYIWSRAERRANAAYFNARIESVITPKVKDGHGHVWHQYTIRVDGEHDHNAARRDAEVKQLTEAGVGTGIFYPVPAHQQGYMCDLVKDVKLPVHPQLSQADFETIVTEVNKL